MKKLSQSLGLVLLLWALGARAHPLDYSVLKLNVKETEVSAQFEFHPDILEKVGHGNASIFLGRTLLTSIRANDAPLRWSVPEVSGKEGAIVLATEGRAEQGIERLAFDFSFIKDILDTYQVMVTLTWDGTETVFSANRDSLVWSQEKTENRSFFYWVKEGIRHIGAWPSEWLTAKKKPTLPDGIDHILFLLGLVLLSRGLKDLIWLATGFTLGHSLTLALGLWKGSFIPSAWVEPLIALTIAFTALESVFSFSKRIPYLALTAMFGLIHGAGFANALEGVQVKTLGTFLKTLAGFNLGIEFGQVAILILLWPLSRGLSYLGARERLARQALSFSIAGLALYWFWNRL